MELLAQNSGEREDIRPRIVIVENEPKHGGLLLRQLQKANLTKYVKFITDGKTALDYLNEEASRGGKLIALFVDLNLSRSGGLHVLEEIRSRKDMQDLPVIVMTSSTIPEDLAKCQELGVSCYLHKPITFESFIKAVADCFHGPRGNLENLC
jgi:CheY-like chemotaxis protein